MMTLDQAKAFFKMWPRWVSRSGEVRYYDHEKIQLCKNHRWMFPYAVGASFADSAEDFISKRKRVVVPDHVPQWSWWLDCTGGVFRVYDNTLVKPTRLQRRDTTITDFAVSKDNFGTLGYTRITPENFPWEAKMDPVMREAMVVAVFGSVELAKKAIANGEVVYWSSPNERETKPVTVTLDLGAAFNDAVKNCDERIARSVLGGSVDKPKSKLKCQICGEPMTHNYEHAVFDRISCAKRAAEAYKAADVAMRFLCGLNLQDHSVKEQRELLDVVRKLQKALRPEPDGSAPGSRRAEPEAK